MKKKIIAIAVALALVGAVLFGVVPAMAATPGVLDHVQVTPTTATIAPNGTVQLVAQGYDDTPAALTTGITYAWLVTSGTGTVNGAGLYTAAATTGTAIVQVTAIQNVTLAKVATATITVTQNGQPTANLQTAKLQQMIGSYLNSVGFDNFLGAQWQVKNGTAVDTIKAIPGVVQAASTTAITMLVNGQTAPVTFTLTATSIILPKATVLAATDKVVVVTTNDIVTAVIKVNTAAGTGTVPPGLHKNGKEQEGKKTPHGWSMGKKMGWGKSN